MRPKQASKTMKQAASKWFEIAQEELTDRERVEVQLADSEKGASGATFYHMDSLRRGKSGESEWIVFKRKDDAEKHAVYLVKEQLKDEPENFSATWLQGFLSVEPAVAREIATESADSYVEMREEDDLLFEAGLKEDWEALQESLDEAELDILGLEEVDEDADADNAKQIKKLQADIKGFQKQQEKMVDDARDAVHSNMEEETLEKIQKDLLEYLKEMGFDFGTFTQFPKWITLDTKAAAQDAVDTDGIAHFLGADIQLPSGAIAYGQN